MTLRQLWAMWKGKIDHEARLMKSLFGSSTKAEAADEVERIPYSPDVIRLILNNQNCNG